MDQTGEDYNGLHLGKLEKNVGPPFFKLTVCQFIHVSIYKAGESFSVVAWRWICKWKTLDLPIWCLELIINEFKQNYLKQRDLAPLRKHFFIPFPVVWSADGPVLIDGVLPLRRVQSKSSWLSWTNPQVDESKLQSVAKKLKKYKHNK